MNLSAMLSSTMMRLPARHCSPLPARKPISVPSKARSKSALSRMILADFPPSSRPTFLRLIAASAMMRFPVAVPPIKPTTSMPGCFTNCEPAPAPGPVMTCTTPSGRPASWRISTKRMIASGAYSLGLTITELPSAIAAAIFIEPSTSGAFHGAISRLTPTGSRVTIER